MKGSPRTLFKGLAFRTIIPVVTIIFLLGTTFYIFVLRSVSDFAVEEIKKTLEEMSHEIYNICDRNLNELLVSGMGDNRHMVRINKGLAVGTVEDFMRQNNIEGAVTEYTSGRGKELLSVGKLPKGFFEAIEKKSAEHALTLTKYDGEKYYSLYIVFAPWNWHIVIAKRAEAYSALMRRVYTVYGISGAILVFSTVLLLLYLSVTVKRPISNIIARLEKGEKPDYRGISEFEYLSGRLGAAMEMKDSENRMLNNIYHIAASRRGEEFFGEVVMAIGRIFGMNSFIGKIVPESEDISVVAMYYEGDLKKGSFVSLKGSPCEGVVQKKHMRVIERDAFKEYPDAELLTRTRADSYIGVAIFDRKDDVIGILNAFGGHREFSEADIKVFQTIGQMAAIEFEMLEKEEAEERMKEELYQSQKLEALGTLAGGVAHDFNNILQGILGYASLLKMKVPETDPTYNALSVIESSAERAGELTRQLLGFARKGKYVVEPLNLNDIVGAAYKIISRTFDRSIEVKTTFEDRLWAVDGDRSQLEHVVLNLCLNARDSMPEGGELSIRTANIEFSGADAPRLSGVAGRYAAIVVSDTGLGIDEEVKDHISEPFFTTKEKGKGTGMGLAMVYGVVKNHDGFVTVESEAGKGSTFTIYLPAVEKEAASDEPDEKSLSYGKGTIMIVDDEDFVRSFAKETLEKLGYEVIEAAGGQEAVSLYSSGDGKIDLVILDLIMPRMSGEETYRELKKRDDHVKVLISSGYGSGERTEELMKESNIVGFIQKPYNIIEIAETVKKAMSSA
jgi:two-component system cell cycle sensor histidine kinase/response regulator CckA